MNKENCALKLVDEIIPILSLLNVNVIRNSTTAGSAWDMNHNTGWSYTFCATVCVLIFNDSWSCTVECSKTSRHYKTTTSSPTVTTYTKLTDTQFSTHNFINILYFNIDFQPFVENLTFYICKLSGVLRNKSFKNTSLKMATIGGRNV